jgi:hypothetical protein
MSTRKAWHQSAEVLRAVVAEKGVLGDDELTTAFWEVPRHRFIDITYEYNPIDYSIVDAPLEACGSTAGLSHIGLV